MRKMAIIGSVLIGLAINACADRISEPDVTAHPEGWTQRASQNFHGQFVLESPNASQSCTTCHGNDYKGGSSGVSCQTSGCHPAYPHGEGFADVMSLNFHAGFIAESAWDITQCQSCHGADYAGMGIDQKNCLTCHTQENGPEACNTCHGGAESFAPPPDLLGRTSTTEVTVGAHQLHLGENEWASAGVMVCSQCHVVPNSYAAAGHLDTVPVRADLTFGDLASHGGELAPMWDPASATCSDVYCHGGFSFSRDASDHPWGYTEEFITGNDLEMKWTDVGSGQAQCGSCHGLPPQGHVEQTACYACHGRVVDVNRNIIDKSLHINGQIDLF